MSHTSNPLSALLGEAWAGLLSLFGIGTSPALDETEVIIDPLG